MQQTNTKEVQGYARLVRKGDRLGIVKEIKNLPCRQIVYAQNKIYPKNEIYKFSGNFLI